MQKYFIDFIKVLDINPDIINVIEYLMHYQEEVFYVKWLRDLYVKIINIYALELKRKSESSNS